METVTLLSLNPGAKSISIFRISPDFSAKREAEKIGRSMGISQFFQESPGLSPFGNLEQRQINCEFFPSGLQNKERRAKM
ncbi:hypothetical protein [uncultured Neglectibacter sp.]|uniref:hypothetical protein n=1 Tax=uncultured Neglectibacter sp. TaxID=1924108 RepID=UPI0034DDE99F